MRSRLPVLVLVTLLGGVAAPAHGQERGGGAAAGPPVAAKAQTAAVAPTSTAAASAVPTVALLPLAADERHRLYGRPVAVALAKRLRAGGGFAVDTISPGGAVPARVNLVIDGRIVATRGGVLLEARVRDPGRGLVLASVATGEAPLTRIDELAAGLAAELLPRLEQAVADQRAAAAAEARARMPRPAPAVAASAAGAPASGSAAAKADARPPMVIFTAAAPASFDGVIAVGDIATRGARALAERLGYRPVVVADRGVVQPGAAVRRMAAAAASYGLALDVRDLHFSWQEVLSGTARVRIVLFGPAGRTVFDRVALTDTVVGSRGDRHEAVVHFLIAQVADIAAPRLREVLPSR